MGGLRTAGPMPSLEAIAIHLEGRLEGPADQLVEGVRGLETAGPRDMAFVEDEAALARLKGSLAGAVLAPEGLTVDRPCVRVERPRVAFARLLALLYPPPSPSPGVHHTATVHPLAQVDPSASIGPWCSLGPRTRIGPGVVLVARVALGSDVTVAEGSRLEPCCSVGDGSFIGRKCHLDAHVHLGLGVTVEDQVYLGAHTVLETAARIGQDSKLDNLVVVETEASLGKHCILVSQSLVRTRASLGSGVIVAGQGLVDTGAKLADRVVIGGRSRGTGELLKPGPYTGDPARPQRQDLRRQATEGNTPQLVEKALGLL